MYLGPGIVKFHSKASEWLRRVISFWLRKILGILIKLQGSVQPLSWIKAESMALLWDVPFGEKNILAFVPGLHMTLVRSGYSVSSSFDP